MLQIEIDSIYPRNNAQQYSAISRIDKVNATDLDYDKFFQRYMLNNCPVIINNAANTWECSKNWINPEDESCKINIEYLKSRIPSTNVPVADCSRQYQNSHVKMDLQFHNFLDQWKREIQSENRPFSGDTVHPLLYLKDWHLREAMPEYEFYRTPPYFGSDWLNEYLIETHSDDYMFVYMGPKGSWTPFHADVFSSFSWSTNIVGCKKWILLVPGEERKLFDRFGNVPFSIDNTDELTEAQIKHFVIEQNAGETVFVPSGWYHQVWNADHTISINHNWFNGCNVDYVYQAIYENYLNVLKEINDCRDMEGFEEHCQVMLKALHGMNFVGFLNLIEVICENRLKCLMDEHAGAVINGFKYGRNHCVFDLRSIVDVLRKMKDECCDIENITDKCLKIIGSIDEGRYNEAFENAN